LRVAPKRTPVTVGRWTSIATAEEIGR
jgi:hypothetical protein